MRVSLSIPAPTDTRFGPEAFDASIGTVVSVVLPNGSASATVVSALVFDDGAGAILTLELPDDVVAAIADPLGEEE